VGVNKKIRYQVGLITDFVRFICLNYVITRPGSFTLPSKRRSNREERNIPVTLIIMIMLMLTKSMPGLSPLEITYKYLLYLTKFCVSMFF
jgi:hypothetical protein